MSMLLKVNHIEILAVLIGKKVYIHQNNLNKQNSYRISKYKMI